MLGFVKKLKEKLAKTKNSFVGKIAEAINLRGKVDEELMEQLEEILLQADIGADLSFSIIDELRDEVRYQKITDTEIVRVELEKIIQKVFLQDYEDGEFHLNIQEGRPNIVLFIGVNGVGKTTTIGKLAKRYNDQGKKVHIIAADTFRAAAIEQLEIWANRAGVTITKKQHGSDPSSVIFDGVEYAQKNNYDLVLIDTAGRQHNRVNLMNELAKIGRTIKKVIPEAPHESMLVIDATTGQNGISQAKFFNKIIPLTGLVLTKLDGTAKGGIVIGIKHQLNTPVKLIGVGEQVEDLQDFEPKDFVQALFEK